MTNTTESKTNKWWGYIHCNGTIQVKRFFDRRDIDEANESDFVATVHGPFDAVSRQAAINYMDEWYYGKDY
jgi:hypothetical protein